MTADQRRHAPAAERNLVPILEVLRRVLPPSGLVLEVASGTGQHVVGFARALPELTFQPSDRDDDTLASVRAFREHEGLPNVLEPVVLDVTARTWPVTSADAIFCANMIHIAPWAACLGLLAGAGRVLPPGAPLVLYGPFKRSGEHTAPSNAAFDESLRQRNPTWGVRDLADVSDEASARGLVLDETVPMPANNLTVVFRRQA